MLTASFVCDAGVVSLACSACAVTFVLDNSLSMNTYANALVASLQDHASWHVRCAVQRILYPPSRSHGGNTLAHSSSSLATLSSAAARIGLASPPMAL